MTPNRLLVIAVALASMSACADDAPDRSALPGTSVAAGPVVRIERSRFSAAELTVAPGTTVVFVNDDAFAHTVTSRNGSPTAFDSGELGQGDTFAMTFEEPGTYAYFCRVHPTMRAVVVVA